MYPENQKKNKVMKTCSVKAKKNYLNDKKIASNNTILLKDDATVLFVQTTLERHRKKIKSASLKKPVISFEN